MSASMKLLSELVEDGLNGRLVMKSDARRWTVEVSVTTRDGRTHIDLESTARTLESAARMILEGLAAANIRPGGTYTEGRWINQ